MASHSPYTLLWGGYDGGNVGDYLTLAVGIHDHEKQGQPYKVLNIYGDKTRRQFPDSPIVNIVDDHCHPLLFKLRCVLQKPVLQLSKSFFACLPTSLNRFLFANLLGAALPWLSTVANAEKLYMVGGGYVNDLFESVSRDVLQVAHICGVPIETAPLGIGPFYHEQNKAFYARVFKSAKLRVRDLASLQAMRQLGVAAELKPDDGFRVDELMPQWLRNKNIEVGKKTGTFKIGICVFEQFDSKDTQAQMQWWHHVLSGVKRQIPDAVLEGFSFDAREKFEYQTLNKLLPESGWPEATILKPFADFRDAILHVYQNYDLVITSRFHAAVVSQVFGIDTLAFASGDYYRAKMECVRDNSDKCHVISSDTDKPEDVIRLLMDLRNKKEGVPDTVLHNKQTQLDPNCVEVA